MSNQHNIQGLIKSRKQEHLKTMEEIKIAIDTLKQAGKPITIMAVAKKAGCSRTTIYKYPEIIERIQGLQARASKGKRTDSSENRVQQKQNADRVRAQYDKIKKLEQELNLAMLQLVNMEDLQREASKLRATNERLQGQKTDLQREIIRLNSIIANRDTSSGE